MENNQKTLLSHKRRSSIFQSRLIAFDQDKGNLETRSDEYQYFNLEEYMNDLNEERRNWQSMYKERKKQRRHLLRRKANIEVDGQDFDPDILSDSEKSFFSVAPDYNEIYTNISNLLNMTVKIGVLNQLYHKVNETFVLKMDEKISNMTRAVIESTKVHD